MGNNTLVTPRGQVLSAFRHAIVELFLFHWMIEQTFLLAPDILLEVVLQSSGFYIPSFWFSKREIQYLF